MAKAQRTPVEDPNTLKTVQTARVIDILAEGPIAGMAEAATPSKSVMLGGSPIVGTDGGTNYRGITYAIMGGHPEQAAVGGFESAETPLTGGGIGGEIHAGSPLTINVPNLGYKSARIGIRLQGLYDTDTSSGDMHGSKVELVINVKPVDGGYGQNVDVVIEGKTVGLYQQDVRVPLAGNGPWTIKVTRVTGDSDRATLQNKTYLGPCFALIENQLIYPDTAIAYVGMDAEQFGGSVPSRAYDIKGRLVLVPVNYDPVTRAYTGLWNGTFKLAWTDNPAWVLYDLLTEPRAGLGKHIKPSMVDKWSLYEIAQYCDQLVPNGKNSFEPRYTFNGVLTTREDAYKVLQAVASNFRAMTYWGAGTITVVADKPSDPVKLISAANVLGGEITYEGTAVKARHNIVHVLWNDPEQDYALVPERVVDDDALARFGPRQTEVVAYGCTSRGQAHRFGKWLLYTENYETQTATWRGSLDQLDIRPGDVVAIADAQFAGFRRGGRIVSATTTTVTLDTPFIIKPEETGKQLIVTLPDGSLGHSTVVNTAGSYDTLTVSPPFPAAPVADAMWIFSGSKGAPRLFRVISLAEIEANVVQITALEHDPGKYDWVELGIKLEKPLFTDRGSATGALQPPTDLAVQEWLGGANSTTLIRAAFSWVAPLFDTRVSGFEVQALSGGIAIASAAPRGTTYEFQDLTPGTYVFQVRSTSDSGAASAWATTSPVLIDGRPDAPTAPTGLFATGKARRINLRWTNPAVRTFNCVEVWASGTNSLGSATKIGEATSGSFQHSDLGVNETWFYWFRTRDVAAQFSGFVGPATATTTLLIADNIQDGIINTAKFASGLTGVEIFEALPASGNYVGRTAVLTGDGKLYRFDGAAWTKAVAAVDVTGQLTGDQLADLAVGPSKIAAGAVLTSHLAVGSSNTIWNPCLTVSVDGWSSSSFGGVSGQVLGCAQTNFPNWSLAGHGTGYLHIPGGLGAGQGAVADWRPEAIFPGVSAKGTTRYGAQALVQAHNCQAFLQVIFLAGDGTTVLATPSTDLVGPTGYANGFLEANYLKLEIVSEAPAGTAYAILRVVMGGVGAANPFVFFTKTMLGELPPNATSIGAWSAGGLTEVRGGMVRTRTIQADRIAANSLTANEIMANSITTATIQAGAIKAAQIAAGELRAVHMASETIITQAAQMGTAVIGQAQLQDAAITSAKIGTAEITSAKIGNLEIGTSKIAGSALSNVYTVSNSPGVSSVGQPYNGGTSAHPYWYSELLSLGVALEGDGKAIIMARTMGISIAIPDPPYWGGGDGGGGDGD